MQHHRFTNDKTKDPDVYVGTGPWWLLPFKWLSLDLSYLYFYSRPSVFLKRPKGERLDLLGAFVFGAGVVTAVIWAGWLEYYVLLFVVPGALQRSFWPSPLIFCPTFRIKSKISPFSAPQTARVWNG
jgi:fatty acid desaturase